MSRAAQTTPTATTEGGDLARPPAAAPRNVRWLCLVLVCAALGGLGWVGTWHVKRLSPDFEYFYKAAAWLWQHGTLDRGYDVLNGQVIERGTLDWYWPAVARLMTPFALLPQKQAGYVWVALNMAATLAVLRLVGRHLTSLPPADWPVTQLVPLLLLGTFFFWEYRLDQINNFTLLLMLGSFVCWQSGRPKSAGLWLGLAIILKLTPALLVVWFALKREFRVVTATILTVLLAGPVADALVLGPHDTVAAYRNWAQNAVLSGSQTSLIVQQRELDWRNQSAGAVASRWLHPVNYVTKFDNDPRMAVQYNESTPAFLNVAHAPLPWVARGVTALMALSLLALVWLARRPARALTAWQLRCEWALFVLAMLWFMPVMRFYHMVWALPALSVLGAGMHYSGLRTTWTRVALVCVLLLPIAQLTLLHRPLVAGGSVLAVVVLLAIPLISMLMRLSRRPDCLPSPAMSAGDSSATPDPAIAAPPRAPWVADHA